MPKKKSEPKPLDVLKEAIAAQVGLDPKQIIWDPATLEDTSGTMPDGWIVSYLASQEPTIVVLNPQMSRTYTIQEYQEWKSKSQVTNST